MTQKELHQITQMILNLPEHSRSLSIFNAYMDAFGMNIADSVTDSKEEQQRVIDDLVDIFAKYQRIIEGIRPKS